jgi:hypothetical protein
MNQDSLHHTEAVIVTRQRGRSILERRRNDGQMDTGFSLEATGVLGAVPSPDGRL